MKPTVLDRARRYISKCTPAVSGQGGHNTTFHVASVLVHGFALVEADGMALLREWNGSCRPPWSEADILHKIRSAMNAQHSELRGYLLGAGNGNLKTQISDLKGSNGNSGVRVKTPPKPKFCPMVLKRISAKTKGVDDVLAFVLGVSPVPVDRQDSAAVLRWLYPQGTGEKVLIFSDMKSQGQLRWDADKGDRFQDRHMPSGPDGVWFLPQPVDGEFHPNPRLSGKMSRRSEESVTAWRYAVLESDEADADDWLRCLIQMPLRIASICESGGRSIHALVRLDAASKADWDGKIGAIKPVLVTLGADAGALSAVRLTRLPQAQRGERVQRLLYLNPDPDGKPILGGAGKRKDAE